MKLISLALILSGPVLVVVAAVVLRASARRWPGTDPIPEEPRRDDA